MSKKLPNFAPDLKIFYIMETMEIVRQNFDKYRKERGQTINEIASNKGVTRQTIYSLFRKGCTLSTLEKIAELVGVETWELLKPQDQENKGKFQCPYCGKELNVKIGI